MDLCVLSTWRLREGCEQTKYSKNITFILKEIYKYNKIKPIISDSHERYDVFIDLREGEMNKSFESMISKLHNMIVCDIIETLEQIQEENNH